MEWSVKKRMEQIGAKLMENLFNDLQDSKREMKEKLNQVMNQTKSLRWVNSKCSTTREKLNKFPLGQILTTAPSSKKSKIIWIVRQKALFYKLHEVSCTINKNDAIISDDVYIPKFIAAWKLISTVKTASAIHL